MYFFTRVDSKILIVVIVNLLIISINILIQFPRAIILNYLFVSNIITSYFSVAVYHIKVSVNLRLYNEILIFIGLWLLRIEVFWNHCVY